MQYRRLARFVLLAVSTLTTLVTCTKSNNETTQTNPFSRSNIEKALQLLGRPGPGTPEFEDKLYTYLKFEPNEMSSTLLKQLEADDTIRVMDFPFANGELYTDEFALNEEKMETLKDGWLYAVMKKNNPLVNALKAATDLHTTELDELYLPEESDEELQLQILRQAGYDVDTPEEDDQQPQALSDASEIESKASSLSFRICLFKRPTGYVRYWDNQFGRLEPVRNMQVWGLVFGIPVHTFTDANGYYRFPWRFNVGTIMGTHAKNPRVNVKPLNTHGTVIQVIPQLIGNFIAGSVHIKGWVGSCAMRNEVNFHFEEHKQNRYWSQILNAVYFHDLYSQQQGIPSAPTDHLVIYAQWANTTNRGDFGSAGAPMLYHLTGGRFTDGLLGALFDFSPTASVLGLLHGLLPDITLRVTGDYEPSDYEPRLAQTVFHELAHASHFRRVNADFWLDLMAAATFHGNDACKFYGCGGKTDDGNVQVAESWAEYMGTYNALLRYPNGKKESQYFKSQLLDSRVRFDKALEEEEWFANEWIPTGIYNDLKDTVNTATEPFDKIGGASIQQMYNVLNSDVDSMCKYQNEFLRLYPRYARADVESIFAEHGITGCPVPTVDLVVQSMSRNRSSYDITFCNYGTGVGTGTFLFLTTNVTTGQSYESPALYPYSVPTPGTCVKAGSLTCFLIGDPGCNLPITVTVKIDSRNTVAETNENNNTLTVSF